MFPAPVRKIAGTCLSAAFLISCADIAKAPFSVSFQKEPVQALRCVCRMHLQFPVKIRINIRKTLYFILRIRPPKPVHAVDPQVNFLRQCCAKLLQQRHILRHSYRPCTQRDPFCRKQAAFFGKLRNRCHFRMKSRPKAQLFYNSSVSGIDFQRCLRQKRKICLCSNRFGKRTRTHTCQPFPVPRMHKRFAVRRHHYGTYFLSESLLPIIFCKRKPLFSVLFKLVSGSAMLGKGTVRTVVITTFQAASV